MDDDDDEDDEWAEDDFEFRPDVPYRRGLTYSVQDLDLRRPAAAKNPPRPQFETTTAEVLKKADFRIPLPLSYGSWNYHQEKPDLYKCVRLQARSKPHVHLS